MTTPISLKERSFFALPTPKYSSLVKDDFVHKKLETLKFKASTKNDSSFEYKSQATYNYEPAAKFALSDELKFGFPYQGFYSQFRVDRKGNIRLHFDLGNFKLVKEQNLYSQVKFDHKLDSVWLRIGTNFYSNKCQSHHRFERDTNGQYFFSYKNICRYPNFVFGFATILNLQSFKLTRYNAAFTYTHNQFEVGFQHETPRNDSKEQDALNNQQLGRLTAGVNYKHDDKTNLALQVRRVFSKNKPVTFNFAVSHLLRNDLTLKFRVNQDLKLTGAVKYKLDQTVSLTASTQLALKKEKGPVDTSLLIPVPFGYQLDFNI